VKVAIQGLSEHPVPIVMLLEKEKPEATHIICSEYELKQVDERGGYKKSNREVIDEAAKKTKTKVTYHKCDVFDPSSIGEAISEIIREVKPNDELIINYTGGAAGVKLILGAAAVVLSRFMRLRIIYAIKYPDLEKYIDQTEPLKKIFRQLYEVF
jgi:hypothetical protein